MWKHKFFCLHLLLKNVFQVREISTKFCILRQSHTYECLETIGGEMKAYIKERTINLADYIVQNNETIRKTATVFNLSKSTVHNDLSKRLQNVDEKRYKQVKNLLDTNFAEKHIRGGQSTKEKYERQK